MFSGCCFAKTHQRSFIHQRLPDIVFLKAMSFWSSNWNQLKLFLHRQTLPGFKGIPIAVILKYLWKEIWRDDIVTRANSMAYSFFLSIFPGLLVFLALLPYLPVGNMVTTLRRGYVGILPKDMPFKNTISGNL